MQSWSWSPAFEPRAQVDLGFFNGDGTPKAGSFAYPLAVVVDPAPSVNETEGTSVVGSEIIIYVPLDPPASPSQRRNRQILSPSSTFDLRFRTSDGGYVLSNVRHRRPQSLPSLHRD
eukprot:tig00001160_g7345.t1